MTVSLRYLWPCLFLLLEIGSLHAADWPIFGRDATRNSASPEKNPPTSWQVEVRDDKNAVVTPARNIKWSAQLGDHTKGDPVVANGLVWVGTNNGRPRDASVKQPAPVLMCFRESDGKFLYQYVTSIPKGDPFSDLAYVGHTSSPMSEGERLWFTTMLSEVICLDVGPLQRGQGLPREVWKLDMRKELSVLPSWDPMGWSKSCSISLPYKDFIYVTTSNGVDNDGRVVNPRAPTVLCLNKHTGKLIWSDNSPGANIVDGQYSSPLVVEIGGKAQVIVPMGDGWVRSFDALTGAAIWQFDANPKEVQRDVRKWAWNNLFGTPVLYENRVFIATGNSVAHPTRSGPGWIYCLDPTRKGDISLEILAEGGQVKANANSGVVWRFGGLEQPRKKRFTGAIANLAIADNLVVVPDSYGYVLCLDARTGQLHWKEDVLDSLDATPLIVDGKIYLVSESGEVFLFELSKSKKLLGKNEVHGPCTVAPVFANGVLYLATYNTLYAIAGTDKHHE